MTTTSSESVPSINGKNDINLDALFQGNQAPPLGATKRSIWSSIRFKATLLALAIGIVPVIVIGGVAYYFANQSITQKVASEQQFKTIELADKLNLFMFERFGDIQVLANLPFLNDPKVQAVTTLQDRKTTLDKYAETYAVYDNIVVADLNGNVIIEAGKEKTLSNIGFQDYFKAARNGQIYVSGKQSIFWAAPLRNKVTQEIIGVVRTRMPSSRLDRLAQAYTEGNQEYLFADETGRIFASKQVDNIERDSALLVPGLDKLAVQKQPATIFPTPTQLVGYAPIKKFENMPLLGWSVITVADPNTTFKAQRELLLTLASGTAIAALLVGALATWIASQGTRPIAEATGAVEKLGKGELDTRIPVRGNDELAILGTNINQMAEQIQTLLDNAQKSAAEIERQKEAVVQESEVLQSDVGHILDVVSAVEDGDLTVQADVNDRATGLVSDTLNRLVEQLGQVLSQVQVNSQQVSTRSSDLEELAKTVASNAASQAQEAQRVLSLTNQVQDSASSSAKEIDVTNQSLLNMTSTVEQGQSELNAMNQGISDLQQGTDRIVQQMKTLGEFVGLAEQFVQDQSQIASLTQVLALNATLVAARASEQKDPRKFMVVAREFEAIAGQVGNLAQQTNSGLEALQQRTSQINAVVSGVDAEVQGLGRLVNDFTKGVEQSSQVFSNVQTITGDVVQAGAAVTKSNQEIIAAAQATAQAMRDIAVLANRTAKLTQVSRVQSEQMGSLSNQLLKNVQFFRLPDATLQQHEANQRVNLSQDQQDQQDQQDTVLIEPSETNASIGLVSASESVLSRSL
jgi:methyl-accepting chemotaxis protein PixJ